MNPRTQTSVALCLLFVSSVACGRSPIEPDPVVLSQQYLFACGRWSPEAPPVTRALVDLRMHGQTVDGRPTPEAIGAITAAGGRIAYVYNVPIVRAEMHRRSASILLKHLAKWFQLAKVRPTILAHECRRRMPRRSVASQRGGGPPAVSERATRLRQGFGAVALKFAHPVRERKRTAR
jgi:hypothetical protein